MVDDFIYRLIAFAGFCIFPCLAWLTGGCRRIDRKTVAGSLLLIWGIGVLTFWLPWSRQFLGWINDVLVAILAASQKGTMFLFGPLALGPGQSLADGTTYLRGDYSFMGDHFNNPTYQDKSLEQDKTMVNARLGWRNDHWDAAIWVKNATDEAYSSTSAAPLVFAGTEAQFLEAPRTYGATLRYNFTP